MNLRGEEQVDFPDEISQVDQNLLQPTRNRERPYAAPRKFDIATMFVVTIFYSVILGGLTALECPPIVVVSVLGFISSVGLAQAILFGGNRPRLASLIVGVVLFPTFALATMITSRYSNWFSISFTVVFSLPFGLLFGYVIGTTVGGIFLVADKLRRGKGVID